MDSRLEFCTGAGAVKSRRSTAEAVRMTTLYPTGVLGVGLTAAGIPQDQE